MTYGAIVLSLLIAIVYYFSGDNVVVILKTITSAAVNGRAGRLIVGKLSAFGIRLTAISSGESLATKIVSD